MSNIFNNTKNFIINNMVIKPTFGICNFNQETFIFLEKIKQDSSLKCP